MTSTTLKHEILRLADRLPEYATWEDVQYQIYFRQVVEAGLEGSREGRVMSEEEARRRFAQVVAESPMILRR